jgi:hypothetical protein
MGATTGLAIPAAAGLAGAGQLLSQVTTWLLVIA